MVPVDIVRDITAQLVRSVNFMHNMKLVHCDLKPDNIMFKSDRSHEIEIIDFNSACELARKTADYVQSRPYRAPEVVLDVEYNEKIDMWSIGCIILEMILGHRIFETNSEIDLFKKYIEVCGLPNRRFVAKGRRANIFIDRLGKFKVKAVPKVSEVKMLLEGFDDELIDFVDKLIRIDPDERMNSVEALKHKWIQGKGMFE
jgi:dual specificity tyrosine-phosphorylation-regulated kinase 2/3/4